MARILLALLLLLSTGCAWGYFSDGRMIPVCLAGCTIKLCEPELVGDEQKFVGQSCREFAAPGPGEALEGAVKGAVEGVIAGVTDAFGGVWGLVKWFKWWD